MENFDYTPRCNLLLSLQVTRMASVSQEAHICNHRIKALPVTVGRPSRLLIRQHLERRAWSSIAAKTTASDKNGTGCGLRWVSVNAQRRVFPTPIIY